MDKQFVYVCTLVAYRTNEQTQSEECICDTDPVRHIFTTQIHSQQWLDSAAKLIIHEGGSGWSYHYAVCSEDHSNGVVIFEYDKLRYHLQYARKEVIS